jgi:hypothetical protein
VVDTEDMGAHLAVSGGSEALGLGVGPPLIRGAGCG